MFLVWLLACAGPGKPLDTGDYVVSPLDTAPPRDTGDVPVDADGDGVDNWSDCDDADARVYPGAPETCDGRDNDCDEAVDEDAADEATFYADGDGDGYGDPSDAVVACEAPAGAVAQAGDCDDSDADIHPGAPPEACDATVDQNCDGSVGTIDGDGDGVVACLDCDDADANAFPGGVEVCGGGDEDCDGRTDDADDDATGVTPWFADADGDGHGGSVSVELCAAPVGFVASSDDCDDGDATVYPGASETCDGRDEDCDTAVDEEVTDVSAGALAWYADTDEDGYGAGSPSYSCAAPAGATPDGSDCDDTRADIRPGAPETCDGADQDCDGSADEDAADAPTWYTDEDGDGAAGASGVAACDMPAGAFADATDCDDTDATVGPDAAETCDGVDQDCDGVIDDDPVDGATVYLDLDGDGAAGYAGESACEGEGSGTPSDCDDDDAAVHPDAEETCDGVDEDCDGVADDDAVDIGTWYTDADGDGFGDTAIQACLRPDGAVPDGGDCDDADPESSPGASEVCGGGDEDCDGLVDDADPDVPVSSWYADADGDGYGDFGTLIQSCAAPATYVSDDTDCDDTDAGVHPDAVETCDGVDANCDGDEADATDVSSWYRDRDADGHGAGAAVDACTAPAGYVAASDDCDDVDPDAYPGATETCDGTDEDCDGTADDGLSTGATWYTDSDGDGWGSIATDTCAQPAGTVEEGGDCDDADASVSPGADEVAGNGIDDDCDDRVDWTAPHGTLTSAEAILVISASTASDQFGTSVTVLDVDGDGDDDVLVGEIGYEGVTGSLSDGAGRLYWGPLSGTVASSANDTLVLCYSCGDDIGTRVWSLGDPSGDGADELGTSTPVGGGFVWNGSTTSRLTQSNRSWYDTNYDCNVMAGLGEFVDNSDSRGEVACGAEDETSNTGVVHAHSWSTTSTGGSNSNAVLIYGEATGDRAGAALDGGDDVDGDGVPDLLIGAWGVDTGGSSAGAGYLLLGPQTGTVSLADADARLVGGAAEDELGRNLSFTEDLDGDGLRDLALGAPGQDDGGVAAGAVYLFGGNTLGDLDVSAAFAVVTGESPGDTLGLGGLLGADLDSDGVGELIVGAEASDRAGTNEGAAWIFYGPLAGAYTPADAAGVYEGDGVGGAGGLAAGDIDADGATDLVLAAPDLGGIGGVIVYGGE